jgi:hypothetical protein
MAYDLTKNSSPDRDRVSLNQDTERRYWTARFGVTLEELQEAIAEAGPIVEDVKRALGRVPVCSS